MGLDIIVESPVSNLRYSFRAGSYSGFHEWRSCLMSAVSKSNKVVLGDDFPFKELLAHSDCDGTLNKRQCAELVKDFDMFEEEMLLFAEQYFKSDEDSKWWKEKWRDWKYAVNAVARFGGKVVFC